MDSQKIRQFVNDQWDKTIVPELIEFIKIPNKSPAFDSDWEQHGFMEQAVEQIVNWCEAQVIPGLNLEVVRLPGRTPLIFMDIPGELDDTVLLYGHLDKQPEMVGWDVDKGPWKPLLQDGKLYGRGGADDGYAAYASLTAIAALKQQNIPMARCVVIIEACEESGSYDLPFYVEALRDRIGEPDLVVCLDAGCCNYDQLWITTSLRGMISGTLSIDIIKEGIHSGFAGGIVPSTFLILQQLLSRLEERSSGKILPKELHESIPKARQEEAQHTGKILGQAIESAYPFVEKAHAMDSDPAELILNRTWRPSMEVIGVEGIPPIKDAGNVLRPNLKVQLSLRIPPTCDSSKAQKAIKTLLESDAPYGAKITFEPQDKANGWNAPEVAPWLNRSFEEASQVFYEQPVAYTGEGGTIPFMGMLGDLFPKAQFMITGLLGPGSNAHGPNEFLHIEMGKGLTCAVAMVLAQHYDHRAKG